MAMTKKERAAFDKALFEARIAGALRWTSPVAPDVPPPDSGRSGLTKGWCPRFSGGADVACSSSIGHATGRTDRTTSQREMWLYSSRLLALRASRHEMEQRFAKELAAVDSMIASEEEARAALASARGE